MKFFAGFRYSIFTIILIDFVFQMLNLVYFITIANSNGRMINNLMIVFVITTYFISVLTKKSNMNRFQFFISSIILFSLRDFFDELESVNIFYLTGYLIFNLIGLYDVFHIKKDYGEHIFDFIYFKNWFK